MFKAISCHCHREDVRHGGGSDLTMGSFAAGFWGCGAGACVKSWRRIMTETGSERQGRFINPRSKDSAEDHGGAAAWRICMNSVLVQRRNEDD